MDKEEFAYQLIEAHGGYYDIQHDYDYADRSFTGYAEFHTHGEKYVLSKKAKLWEVNAHEYLFFTTLDTATDADVNDLVHYMTTSALQKVQNVPDHMTSYLSLVIIADRSTPQAISTIKHTRFRKNYLLGFRGWADLRLALIDLETMRVYTNGQGKELKRTLEANLCKAYDTTSA